MLLAVPLGEKYPSAAVFLVVLKEIQYLDFFDIDLSMKGGSIWTPFRPLVLEEDAARMLADWQNISVADLMHN